MSFIALYCIVVALAWIGSKIDVLAKNVAALTEVMRNSRSG